MKQYKNYVVKKRAKFDSISGSVNLPYGTPVTCEEGFLVHRRKRLCANVSQNAFDFFAHNDDANGELRGQLISDIQKFLLKYKERWDRVWEDSVCSKYKRPEHEDFWVWNYDFYNAPIEDLEYIRNLIR